MTTRALHSPALLVALLGSLALSTTARAGGMEIGDTGAEALARGGAFVAKADNPAAVNYNPAGFAKLRGTHFALSANAVRGAYDFRRLGRFDVGQGEGNPFYPAISSEKPWFAAPMHMMLTTDFGVFDRITFAAGFYAPSAMARAYPREVNVGGATLASPQRYDFVDMGGIIAFPTAAMAIRVADWLDIGFTFQAVVTQVQTTTIASVGAACDKPEDPLCDVTVAIEAKDMFSPTGSLGFLLRPSESFEFGGLLRLPSKANLEGNAKLSLGPNVKKLESALIYPVLDPLTPKVKLDNVYPTMARIGARYIFRKGGEEVGDLEADLIWENWSSASKREVSIEAKSLNKPMKAQTIDMHLKDTLAIRAGGSYKVALGKSADLILRFGAFYETASTDISDTSLQVVGAQRLGLTGGLGLRWGRYTLDMAYAHVFFPDRAVGQSTRRAMDFSSTDPNAGPVVGNGTYSASADMFAIQLTMAFGRGVKAERRPGRMRGPAESGAPARQRRKPTKLLDDDYGFRVQGAAARSPRRVAQRAASTGNNLMFDPDEIRLPATQQRPATASAPASTPDQDEVGEHDRDRQPAVAVADAAPQARKQRSRRRIRASRAARLRRLRAYRRAKRARYLRAKRLRARRIARARRARRVVRSARVASRVQRSGSCLRYNAWGRCTRRAP